MEEKQSKNEFLSLFSALAQKYESLEEELYKKVPPAGYWVPMLSSVAIWRGNEIVDALPKYASADHGTNFQCFLKSLEKSISRDKTEIEPFFDGHLVKDHLAEAILNYEFSLSHINHIRASINEGFWKLTKTGLNSFKIQLSPRLQRTALHLLSIKAQFLSSSRQTKKILSKKASHERAKKFATKLMLASKFDDLEVLTVGISDEWEKFLNSASITEAALVNFQAFFAEINKNTYAIWFKEEDLLQLIIEFEKSHNLASTRKDILVDLLRILSPTLEQARTWGLAVPFIKLGKWYVRWPFAFHVLHPNLTILAILMKQKPEAWDRTVGSHSARAADYLVSKLTKHGSLKFATCRVKKNVGDIDIAVLNIVTGDILICEIKTVFDRFRTNYQLKNFTEQRANYSKAADQLRKAKIAIENGNWKVTEIFSESSSKVQSRNILQVVLTWWDIFDPFKGTAFDDVATGNFASFIYLFNLADGDLKALHNALIELSNLPCPAYPRPNQIAVDDLNFSYTIDAQTDLLPPSNEPRRKGLSQLSTKAIQDIACFPDDWKQQSKASGDDPEKYVF